MKNSLYLTYILLISWTACNAPQGSVGTAEARIQVAEGFEVELVAGSDLVDYPMFATLDEYGRLFVFESIGNVYEETQEALDDPQFRIKLLVDTDEDGKFDKATIYADQLSFPQGGVFIDGSLYASSAPDLIKFTDTDGDGVADEKEVILSGWILNVNANSLIGPFEGPDGWLYMTNAIMGFDVETKEGERLKGETARIWRVRRDGSDLEWIAAGGMNNPVELTFTPAGEVIGTETFYSYPEAGLRDALIYWIDGGVYPKPTGSLDRDGLIRTGSLMPAITHYSRLAPSGIWRYQNDKLGSDYQDNLFTAQFNTHRIVRHKLLRDGAGFTTEDETFLWSDDTDFHPTDVLESGDGSLLVVETGGWFIKGCPLSQVSKPELKGAIYRVKRTEAVAVVEDPYGQGIDWDALSASDVVDYLADDRPFVRLLAQHSLESKETGDVITAIDQWIDSNPSEKNQLQAIFALYRTGSEEALEKVNAFLSSERTAVKIAAAHVLGLDGYQPAMESVATLLKDNDLAVRRQAAVALNRMDATKVADALLNAMQGITDRFADHAIILALINYAPENTLLKALRHNDPQVKRAAVISLDQKNARGLQARHIIPFLESKSPEVQEAGLFVAAHHPEWATAFNTFIQSKIQNPEDHALIENLVVSLSDHERMQSFIANQLATGSVATQRFVVEVMQKFNSRDFPPAWVEAVRTNLKSTTDALVIQDLIQLLQLRQLPDMQAELQSIADNQSLADNTRLTAITALYNWKPQISEADFDYIYGLIDSEAPVTIKKQAIHALERGRLTEDQLGALANDYLAKADGYILPQLMPIFRGGKDLKVGEQLTKALSETPVLANFSEEEIRSTFDSFPPSLQPVVEELIVTLNKSKEERLSRLEEIENALATGDIDRGRAIFFGKATCYTCHKIGQEGGDLGPDLTSIRSDRSIHDIIEAVVYPSVSFVREYETYQIKTNTDTHIGIIREESPDVIVLGIAPETSIRIAKSEVVEITQTDVSLMPQGLDRILTEQELSDLMIFLLLQDQQYVRIKDIL